MPCTNPKIENRPSAELSGFTCHREFSSPEGFLMIPIAGAVDRSEPALFVRIHSPIDQMTISWTASRKGGPPDMPHPLTFANNTNIVYMGKTISAVIPQMIGNRLGHEWCVSGFYTYGFKLPRNVDAGLPTGRMQFEKGLPNDNTIPSSFFVNDILGTDCMIGSSAVTPPLVLLPDGFLDPLPPIRDINLDPAIDVGAGIIEVKQELPATQSSFSAPPIRRG